MKKIYLIALTVSALATVNLQAFDASELMKQGASLASDSNYKNLVSNALSAAVSELSSEGFLQNQAAKIPLPKSLETAANLAKKVGGEKWANELITSINAAATKAVPQAATVFSDTIKNMSESDVKNLFSGGNDSVTQYLQKNSSAKLTAVFKPIIEKMMSENSFATAYNGLNSFVNSNVMKSDAAKSLKNLAANLGASEYVPNEGEDLNDYITRKTLDGLFNVMSQKESSLRGGSVGKAGEILQGILK